MNLRILLLACFATGCVTEMEEQPATADDASVVDVLDSPVDERLPGLEGAADEEATNVEPTLAWDGVNPRTSSCWNDRRFVQSTHLRLNGTGQEMPPIIYLYYSPSCRTTWARLTGGSVARPTDTSGGRAEITRNSDGRRYTCRVVAGSGGECTTAMVNDAGVTSYAFGFDDTGTFVAWARTANY